MSTPIHGSTKASSAPKISQAPADDPIAQRASGRGATFRGALGKRPASEPMAIPTDRGMPPSMPGDPSHRPVDERRAPEHDDELDAEAGQDGDASALGSPESSADPRADPLIDADLAPFRVNPALLATRPAAPDPIRQEQAASVLAAELVESMRVGRFGRDGHAVSMRVRTPSGVIGVELREEEGSLRMALDGASAAELETLGGRVQRALRARGIELEVS